MAGFKTHITVSSSCGVAYAAAGGLFMGMPTSVCVLGASMCSVSGMLPDVDSDSGVPLRESLAFASAVVPLLMVPRFRNFDWSPETIAMAGCLIYLAIRFGVGWLLKKYTVHRGMFHSIPAALIATEVAFLVYSREFIEFRYFVAGAVFIGFMSHLILDEIWSVGVKRGQVVLKKSSGTAFKFWGDCRWANFSCYAKLIALSYIVLHDPVWTYQDTPPSENLRLIATRFIDRLRGREVQEEEPPLREIARDEFDQRGYGRQPRGFETQPYETQHEYDQRQPYATQPYATQPQPGYRAEPQYNQPTYQYANPPMYGRPNYESRPTYEEPYRYNSVYDEPAVNPNFRDESLRYNRRNQMQR